MSAAPEPPPESLGNRAIRAVRHPARALAMALAAWCLLADLAEASGIAAAMLGAIGGVVLGEGLARSRLRLASILGGVGVALGVWIVAVRLGLSFGAVVGALGPAATLELRAFLQLGAVALAVVTALRSSARRVPSVLALELALVVASVAVVLAAHRGGVLARPLWLSDWAWRRGVDPADLLLAVGVSAALLSASLLLLEQRGRLGLAALPLLPLIAIGAASCLDVQGIGPDRGEASPEASDEEGEERQNDPPEEGERGPGGRGDQGPPGDGGPPGDAGRGMPDAGVGDGGLSDGGVAGGGDGGPTDGGVGGDGRDGGAGGSSGDGGMTDGGTGGGSPWPGWDAGLDDLEMPPPSGGDPGDGEGSPSGGIDQEDLFDRPPATGDASAAPVAVVLFENDYSPPSETYYFRQSAWSQFDGSRLVPAEVDGADADVSDRFPATRVELPAPPDGQRQPVGNLVALLTPHPSPFGLVAPVVFEPAQNPNPRRFTAAYRTVSRGLRGPIQELFGRPAGDPAWSDDLRRLYLQPHPDPRFAEWAVEVVRDLSPTQQRDAFTRAVAIKLRLDQTLIYSTAERHAEAPDPTVDFFFGNQTGYCVHFAHAAVFLYRAVGIPARIGVGYAAPEARREGGSSLLLQSGDAHAWPEIYLEGVGWTVLDIAAAQNLDPPSPPPDPDMQRQLGEMARDLPPDPEPVEDEDEGESLIPPLSELWGPFLYTTLAVLLALLLALYLVKGWRRLAPRFASQRALPRVGYRALLDRLAEVGLSRAHGETRESFARRVAEIGPTFARATELHLRARLGGPLPDADEALDRGGWTSLSAGLSGELAGAVPPWRRVLGLLHPLSFLDAR